MLLEIYIGTVVVSTTLSIACREGIKYKLKKDGYNEAKVEKSKRIKSIAKVITYLAIPGINLIATGMSIAIIHNNDLYNGWRKEMYQKRMIEPINKTI